MKTNKFILAGLMAVGCFFAACTEETPAYVPAQPETNEIQAYIYNTTPTSVQLTELGAQIPVVIGRNATTTAASFEIQNGDTLGVFECNPVVSFEAGEAVDTLWITCKLNYGESAVLPLSIPEQYTTAYGPASINIDVLVDFTWLDMGKVQFQSNFCGGQATLKIEQAKEYTDANGNLLFRLNSPYYYATGGQWCTVPGLHLQFLLDKDYNAVDVPAYGFIQLLNDGPYFDDGTAPINYAYYDPYNYGQYCFFVNEGNIYQRGILFSDMQGLTLGGEIWQWVEGYPGN